MSRFTTQEFHFQLPGDQWEERTVHVFHPRNDNQTVFMIGRAKIPDEGPIPLEEVLLELPLLGRYDERKILRKEPCSVGPLHGEDVSMLARTGASGEYYRFVCLTYYDSEVTFQFAGPVAARESIDERAEKTLSSVRFWKQA